MIKAIIFDFGGPIMVWNDKPIFAKHEDHRNLERDSIRRILLDYIKAGHKGSSLSIKDYIWNNPPAIAITVEELNEILSEASQTMRIIPEQIEYILELKKRGYKIALLSNFNGGLGELLKDVFKIYHLFDVVVSSYDVKMVKPEPEIYHYALEKLGVMAEESVFTDDLETNLVGAEAVGIKGILFTDFNKFKSDLENILAVE